MIVNTVRMVNNDQVHEFSFGDNQSLKEKLAIGFLNPKDFEKLGLTSELRIKINNNYGQVIIEQNQDINIPQGTILMPVSIWANQITFIENNQPIYKNIKVNVESTTEPVLDFNELITKIKKS